VLGCPNRFLDIHEEFGGTSGIILSSEFRHTALFSGIPVLIRSILAPSLHLAPPLCAIAFLVSKSRSVSMCAGPTHLLDPATPMTWNQEFSTAPESPRLRPSTKAGCSLPLPLTDRSSGRIDIEGGRFGGECRARLCGPLEIIDIVDG